MFFLPILSSAQLFSDPQSVDEGDVLDALLRSDNPQDLANFLNGYHKKRTNEQVDKFLLDNNGALLSGLNSYLFGEEDGFDKYEKLNIIFLDINVIMAPGDYLDKQMFDALKDIGEDWKSASIAMGRVAENSLRGHYNPEYYGEHLEDPGYRYIQGSKDELAHLKPVTPSLNDVAKKIRGLGSRLSGISNILGRDNLTQRGLEAREKLDEAIDLINKIEDGIKKAFYILYEKKSALERKILSVSDRRVGAVYSGRKDLFVSVKKPIKDACFTLSGAEVQIVEAPKNFSPEIAGGKLHICGTNLVPGKYTFRLLLSADTPNPSASFNVEAVYEGKPIKGNIPFGVISLSPTSKDGVIAKPSAPPPSSAPPPLPETPKPPTPPSLDNFPGGSVLDRTVKTHNTQDSSEATREAMEKIEEGGNLIQPPTILERLRNLWPF